MPLSCFTRRISDATLYRLSASRQRGELLEALFPDGLEQLPRLSKPGVSSLHAQRAGAGVSVQRAAGPRRAAVPPLKSSYLQRRMTTRRCQHRPAQLSNALRLAGGLREADAAARRALVITREQGNRFQEAISLYLAGAGAGGAGRGAGVRVRAAAVAAPVCRAIARTSGRAWSIPHLAQRALWFGDPAAARPLADRAWELAHVQRNERDFIRAARLQGEAALGLNDFAQADERLHHALARAGR